MYFDYMAGRWATISQSEFETRVQSYLTAETVNEGDSVWLANAAIAKPELQQTLKQVYETATKTAKFGSVMNVYDRMMSVLTKIHDSRARQTSPAK